MPKHSPASRSGEKVLGIERASFPRPWSRGMFLHELKVPFSKTVLARTDDERLVVITSSAKLRYVFELTRLTVLFDVVATEEEALGVPPAPVPAWRPSASAILLIVAGILVLIGVIRACRS